jgi:hypothetical protein
MAEEMAVKRCDSKMRHTIIVIERDAQTPILERHGCEHYIDAAIATYKTLVEEYEHDIKAGTHHIEMICNIDAGD